MRPQILVREFTDRVHADSTTRTRNELDQLIASVLRDVLYPDSSGLDVVASDALSRVARLLGADAATLALRIDENTFERRVAWHEPSAGPITTDAPRHITAEAMKWVFDALAVGDDAFILRTTDVPDAATDYRDMLEQVGAQAAALVSVRVRGEVRGYVTLYWRSDIDTGTLQAVLPALRILGDVLIAARDRADVERAHRESESRLETVFTAIDEAILLTAVDGTVLYANRAATELFALRDDSLVGFSYRSLDMPVHEDLSTFVEEELPTFATLRDGEPRSNVLEGFAQPDGSRRWLRVATQGLFGDDELLYAVVTTFADVTGLRGLEAQLAQAAKMEALGRLAGGIAHDFNNLLTVISGYAQLMRADCDQISEARADVDEIIGASDRAVALIDQLLSFSRRKVTQPSPVDVNEVVTGMGALLRRLIRVNVEMTQRLTRERIVVCADRIQIEQVMLNLVVNASDAMPDGGKLTVETAVVDTASSGEDLLPTDLSGGPWVMISVSDTGMGMDRETRTRVFEPFFTTKPVGDGTGLGLSTVYGVVSQASGHVVVDSEPGTGSTFRVYLPLDNSDRAAAVDDPGRSDVQGGHEALLVVEDDDAVRSFVVTALRRYGYTVWEAGNGDDARSVLADHDVELVVSDVVLRDTRGTTLAGELAIDHPDLAVILMSGYTEDALPPDIAARFHFIGKPFTPEALARTVRSVLDAASR